VSNPCNRIRPWSHSACDASARRASRTGRGGGVPLPPWRGRRSPPLRRASGADGAGRGSLPGRRRCHVAPGIRTGGASAPGAGRDHPQWTPDAEAVVRERAEIWSHGDPARGEELARGVAEERAAGRQAEITALFLRTLGKKLGYGHPLSEKGGSSASPGPRRRRARLADVPRVLPELTRWRWSGRHTSSLWAPPSPSRDGGQIRALGAASPTPSRSGSERDCPGPTRRWTVLTDPEFVRGQVLEAIEGNARTLARPSRRRMVDLVIRALDHHRRLPRGALRLQVEGSPRRAPGQPRSR